MKLVKDLGTFKNNTKSQSEKRGLFLCPGCDDVVEKRMDAGKKYKSCGCLWHRGRPIHGESHTTLYQKWSSMKARCYYENSCSYRHYGGRGIKVCKEWHGFIKFKEWAVSHGYKKELSIERIDNNGDYNPNNCTFIPLSEQQRNRQDTKLNIAKVLMIRKLYEKTNLTQERIGGLYNISSKYVSKIINRRVWKT